MFTVNIKGQRNPANIDMVKLTIIFYKSGHTRVTKVLNITGPYELWDHSIQQFNNISSEFKDKNKLLQSERLKYLKIAEKWEFSNKNWIPIELSHYYDEQQYNRNRYTTIAEMLDRIISTLLTQERYKNGRVFTSLGTAVNYKYLKKSLEDFTRRKYHRDFSKYLFRDIDEKFLRDYVLHEQQKGTRNGTNSGIHSKLKNLRATCAKAKDEGIYGVNLSLFRTFKWKLKTQYTTPKAVSHKLIKRIENIDRGILSKREELYLDMFLFSFYACGMSPIDVCFLERSCIKNGMIVYERIKIDQFARAILTDKATSIIKKYDHESYMNFVFPIIKKRVMTQEQQYGRVERTVGNVNKTLKKICDHLGIHEHITWSCARSSFISKMVDEGYHPLQIAEQAGNSPQTIYKHYYSITDKEEMRTRMNEIFCTDEIGE